MSIAELLSSIDAEISRLQQARTLLSTEGKGTRKDNAARKSPSFGKKRRKNVLSPEARERIAAAQRKRWAAQKKAAK